MAGCSLSAVLWLDEWFALDTAVTGQANNWVLPSSRWLRTQGYRFARLDTRITVVGSGAVVVKIQTSSNPDAASAIALSGGAAAASMWGDLATLAGGTRTIVADSVELNTENGLRDLLRVSATNSDAVLPAQVRVEIRVSLGN